MKQTEGQISLFDSEINPNFTVINGTKGQNDYKLKCVHVEMKDISYPTIDELFDGFDSIKVITFSYDIQFINRIMKKFKYGEIILGASFLVQKDAKMTEFLAETLANAKEAADQVRKYPDLSEMLINGDLEIHVPTFMLDHRKIYLLKADDGRTRVIKASANMTGRAWNGEHMEFYECDDTELAYETYLEDFETAWLNSEDIPKEIIQVKKTDDPLESNPIINKVKKIHKIVVLQTPFNGSNEESDDSVLNEIDNIQYVIDHEKIKNDYKAILAEMDLKAKNGLIELSPKIIEKLDLNYKKLKQKEIIINNKTEQYPSLVCDFYNQEVLLDEKPMDLHPSEDEVKKDIDELLGLFENFNDFVGDTEKLKESHFKLLNAMFCSPYNAKLRCTAKLKGAPVSSLPLFMLITSKTSNCGKTFMIRAIQKMMTGKELDILNKESCTKDDIRNIQVGCKGTPVFVDELDNMYIARIKDLIKNPQKCENMQLENQPMIVFASNEADEPDEILRKRMVFLRFEGALPSTIDKSSYNGKGDAIIRRLGTAFYREYNRRMLSKIKDLLDYMIYNKERSDSWYPDVMAISSKVIRQILKDYGYTIPKFMRKLTWRDDYSDSAHFIAEDTIKDICDFYVQNKKAFTFTKTHISIELGNDLSCKKKVKSWVNTLPAEMQAKNESSRDCVKMVINRKEFEEFSGFKWKRFGVF